MMSFTERHKAFIKEIQRGIKEFEVTATAHGDTSEDTKHDELMEELRKKFHELFGNDSD